MQFYRVHFTRPNIVSNKRMSGKDARDAALGVQMIHFDAEIFFVETEAAFIAREYPHKIQC